MMTSETLLQLLPIVGMFAFFGIMVLFADLTSGERQA